MRVALRHTRAGALAGVGLALSLIGCDSLLEPVRLHGTYSLVSIAESPLPVVEYSIIDSIAGWETLVLADTLTFGEGGRGEWRSVRRRRDLASDSTETSQFELPFVYRVEAGALLVTFLDCRSTCRATFQERAHRTSDDALSRDRGGAWRYERVSR